jgi:hypothetical protein
MNTTENTSKQTDKGFEVRAYKPTELRKIYGLGYKAFRRQIEAFKDEIGELKGKHYTPRQIEIIVHHLGAPYTIYE